MIVRTVLGDVSPESLASVYMHEHLILDSRLIAQQFPHLLLDSVDHAVEEVAACRASGVGAMVDTMPCAGGRDPIRLAEVSRRSGVAIIATTGLHTAKYYPDHPWAMTGASDELAALFIADLEEGIDRFDHRGTAIELTTHRAGIIKVATSTEELDARDVRLFEGAAMAATATGAPILTHCEEGRGGMEQIACLTELGVAPNRVVLSHTDKVADVGYHRDLLATGVNLEYDQSLRQTPAEEKGTAWLLSEMIEAGHVDQLMLGTDGARRSLWTSLGGAPGLAWLVTGFTDVLRSHGLDEAQLRTMFETNPQRFLSFEATA